MGKPLIFDEIEIQDTDGANASQYDKHLTESATVTPSPTTDQIDDNQTQTAFYDTNFEVRLNSREVLQDQRVYSDASESPEKATILFKRASGAVTLKIESVIINANPVYENNRSQIRLHGSKRAVSIDNSVVEETV